ncbi:DNA adenine methylase [Ureaplasma parvum]|uniref:DNA adenine methylase n=1 Tax=Ureaplasma parvum TaxID=134821 RepID=UPI0026EF00B0|nr:DNA adenine methylase [Ureaplasma parvum]
MNNSLILLIKLFYHNDEINIIADIKKIIDKFNLNINKNSLKKRVNIESYNNLRNVYNNLKDRNNYEANIILLVLVIFGFNSQIRFNNNNEFNIPAGKQDFNKNREINLINFSQSLKYKNIAFQSENFDFILNLIKDNKIEKDDFFYFDPPYLITNATYNHFWSIEEERKLLNILEKLDSLNVKWALSNVFEANGKKNDLLINWSKKFKVIYLDKNYKRSNYQRKNINKDVEVLIINYEN